MSSQQVEGQILSQLRAEPSLSGTNVDAKVDDNSVVVTGNVHTIQQHDLAIAIARSNAGNRKVVDNIEIKQHI
jgi:osmotically-inducible protein OsmY